jgi:hypothetical protein
MKSTTGITPPVKIVIWIFRLLQSGFHALK